MIRIVLIIVLISGCQGGRGGRPTDDVCIGICQYTQIDSTPDEPEEPTRKKKR